MSGEGEDVLYLCYGAGFPPSDLHECGPAVVCHAYSQAAAEAAADRLATIVIEREKDFAEPLMQSCTETELTPADWLSSRKRHTVHAEWVQGVLLRLPKSAKQFLDPLM